MAAPLKTDVDEKIRLLLAAGVHRTPEIRHALAKQGIRIGGEPIRRRRAEWRRANPTPEPVAEIPTPEPEPVEVVKSFEERGNTGRIECTISPSAGVVTEDDIVRVCAIDLSRWRIKGFTCRAYQTAMKLETKEETETGQRRRIQQHPHVVQLHSVTVDMERILPKPQEDGYDRVFARWTEQAPAYHPIAYPGGDTMLEFDLFDVHFGKLAWRGETGQDYDLRIAESVFANAVEDLLWECRGNDPERIIVPFGNDFVHTDSGQNKTTGGTPVDTDGRRDKIYEVALMAFIRAIERLRNAGPVDIVRVPGNHDRDSSLTMAWALKAWFRETPGVTVDVTPGPRKYRLYGRTLIGYEHGDNLSNAQVRDLPAIMMQEAPRDWIAQAEFREFHIGHRHSERRFTTLDTESSVGLVTRWMHSLSATDAWHHANKFIGQRRAAEVYRYHYTNGYKGHSLALARAS